MKRFAILTLIVVGFLAGMFFLYSCGGGGGGGDSETSPISLVSVDSNGVEGNDDSDELAISSDGRYVAFRSGASNLVADDTNGFSDIFVRDTVDNLTSRVSVGMADTQANGVNSYPAISSDGRYVAFGSYASNLVAGDTNVCDDIFVRDTVQGITSRVSVSTAGMEADDCSDYPAISSNGRYVAFQSSATNLVDGTTTAGSQIFRAPRQ